MSNLTQRRVSQEERDHKIHQTIEKETCFKKVKRKLCSEPISMENPKDIVKVTRNYSKFYQREYVNRVSPSRQTEPSQKTSDFVESLNIANLQKNMSDGKKKDDAHTHQILSKWM